MHVFAFAQQRKFWGHPQSPGAKELNNCGFNLEPSKEKAKHFFVKIRHWSIFFRQNMNSRPVYTIISIEKKQIFFHFHEKMTF